MIVFLLYLTAQKHSTKATAKRPKGECRAIAKQFKCND